MSMPRYSPIANVFCVLHEITYYLVSPIPVPHTIGFVVRSDELLNTKCGQSATGAETPILTLYIYKVPLGDSVGLKSRACRKLVLLVAKRGDSFGRSETTSSNHYLQLKRVE